MGRIKREKRLKRQKAKRRAQNQRKPELDDSEFWRPWNSVLRQAENSGEGGCGNCGECSLACCTARAVKYPDDDAMVTEFDIAQAIGDRINRRYAAGIGLPATLLEKFALEREKDWIADQDDLESRVLTTLGPWGALALNAPDEVLAEADIPDEIPWDDYQDCQHCTESWDAPCLLEALVKISRKGGNVAVFDLVVTANFILLDGSDRDVELFRAEKLPLPIKDSDDLAFEDDLLDRVEQAVWKGTHTMLGQERPATDSGS